MLHGYLNSSLKNGKIQRKLVKLNSCNKTNLLVCGSEVCWELHWCKARTCSARRAKTLNCAKLDRAIFTLIWIVIIWRMNFYHLCRGAAASQLCIWSRSEHSAPCTTSQHDCLSLPTHDLFSMLLIKENWILYFQWKKQRCVCFC